MECDNVSELLFMADRSVHHCLLCICRCQDPCPSPPCPWLLFQPLCLPAKTRQLHTFLCPRIDGVVCHGLPWQSYPLLSQCSSRYLNSCFVTATARNMLSNLTPAAVKLKPQQVATTRATPTHVRTDA